MNIYVLELKIPISYDYMEGCVVVAENESRARILASQNNGDEEVEAWLDATLSTCGLIGLALPGSRSRLILRDFKNG